MGEAACLRRSFSHPSNASREAKEGDPYRALTESISFGRFMSESLAWEKWSTFSHNRYLEEVEQFSKPGSVAQKKAYFEAHYKKRAAMKAAALLGQANATVANKSHGFSPVDSELGKVASDVVINEEQEKDVLETEVAHCPDVNAFYPSDHLDDVQVAKVETCEEVTEQNIEVENPVQLENSKQLENAEDSDKKVVTLEEKMLNKEVAGKLNVALSSNKRQMHSSSKDSIHGRASEIPKLSAKQMSNRRPKAVTTVYPNNKKSVGDLVDKKRLTSKSVHMSINFASRLGETSKNSLRLMSKNSSSTTQNPARASVYGVSKLFSSIVRKSEDRSCSRSSTARGSKPRTSIISSPFSFRSEERAAKRKEFFQKLEEKNNVKEGERTHPQIRYKDKPEIDLKKMRQNTAFRAKPKEDLHHGSRSPSNHMKIPSTQPRSPKYGRKPTPNVVQETSSRLAGRKINQSTTRSVTLPPKKKPHENASPNIQR